MQHQLSMPALPGGAFPGLDGMPAVAPDHRARLAALHGLVDWAEGITRMAQALVEAERRIDIAGLDQTIGRICAGAIDLGPEVCASLRPRLLSLLREMDALTGAMQPDRDPA